MHILWRLLYLFTLLVAPGCSSSPFVHLEEWNVEGAEVLVVELVGNGERPEVVVLSNSEDGECTATSLNLETHLVEPLIEFSFPYYLHSAAVGDFYESGTKELFLIAKDGTFGVSSGLFRDSFKVSSLIAIPDFLALDYAVGDFVEDYHQEILVRDPITQRSFLMKSEEQELVIEQYLSAVIGGAQSFSPWTVPGTGDNGVVFVNRDGGVRFFSLSTGVSHGLEVPPLNHSVRQVLIANHPDSGSPWLIVSGIGFVAAISISPLSGDWIFLLEEPGVGFEIAEMADLNGDGIHDFLVLGTAVSEFEFLGKFHYRWLGLNGLLLAVHGGDLQVESIVSIASGVSAPSQAAAVDYDGDGDLDIIYLSRFREKVVLVENR